MNEQEAGIGGSSTEGEDRKDEGGNTGSDNYN